MAETPAETPVSDLERDLASVLNKHSMDNGSNTPDFVLARYLIRCLDNFREVNNERENWFGTSLRIGNDYVRNESTVESQT